MNICFYKALILWEVKGKKPPYFCRPKFGFLGILPAHFPMNCTHQARSHKWLQKQVSFVHEEEWIIWKNVTSLVLFLLLCNISLNYAIHQYSIHKCIFGEKKMTLSFCVTAASGISEWKWKAGGTGMLVDKMPATLQQKLPNHNKGHPKMQAPTPNSQSL